jgi:hypothetical protein
MKKVVFLIAISLLLTACTTPNAGPKAVVYKSASCGCCVGYIGALQKQGFNVETVVTEDMNAIKQKYNIPSHMESCHTTILDDYVIEGHVPLDIVQALLEEQPAIEGIALPNMPAGTPGMPGMKRGTWTIYALQDGKATVWRTK